MIQEMLEDKKDTNGIKTTRKRRWIIISVAIFILIVFMWWSKLPYGPIMAYVNYRQNNPTTVKQFKKIISDCQSKVYLENNVISDQEQNSDEIKQKIKKCVDENNHNSRLEFKIDTQ